MATDVQLTRSRSFHELNVGKYLNLFGKQKTMKIGFVVNKYPTETKIFKAIAMTLNTKYNAKVISIEVANGEKKYIFGKHFRYKIREEVHTVPLKNVHDKTDLRSKWGYIEIELESINNQQVDLFSVTTYLRKSFT